MSTQPSEVRISTKQPGILVYLCGLATTALVLWIVRRLDASGTNVMGWYVNAIFPVGALLVGMLSGSGYALGSYFLQIKLSRAFVLGMIATGLLDYAAADYFRYDQLLTDQGIPSDVLSFWKYLQVTCEGMTFATNGSAPGSALGAFGYAFKLLELVGFTGGTMLPSAGLRSLPYCGACQVYLKPLQTTYVPSTMTRTELAQRPRKERAGASQAAVDECTTPSLAVARSIAQTPLAETTALLAELPRASGTSAASVALVLKKCPRCDAHHVRMTLNYLAADKRAQSKVLLNIDKTAAQSS